MDYYKINKMVISREASIPDVMSSLEQHGPCHFISFSSRLSQKTKNLQRPLSGLLLSAEVWSTKTLIFLIFSKIIILVYFIDDYS